MQCCCPLEYLSHKKCIAETIPDLHDCMDQLVLGLDAIAKAPADDRIPMACCAFGRYQHCSIQPIKDKCTYDPKAVDYIGVKMIKGMHVEINNRRPLKVTRCMLKISNSPWI